MKNILFAILPLILFSSEVLAGQGSSGGMMTVPDIRLNPQNFSSLIDSFRGEDIKIVVPEKFTKNFRVKKISSDSVYLKSILGETAKIKRANDWESENFIEIGFSTNKIYIELE